MARKSIVLFALMLPMMVLLGAVLFAGCSQQNAQDSPAAFDPQTGHPTGWAAAESHGAAVKSAASGFSSCQECHGSTYAGGISNTSCFVCHGVNAPHPAAPWRGGAWTHATTNAGNAAICSTCHANGANSGLGPNPPAPAGTAPGCFNNTLCHGPAAGHQVGWSDPGQHGVSAEQNFTACKTCHGANYQGGSAATTCYQCHNGPGLDHPAANWVIANHKTAALAGNTGCKTCHGADFLGGGSHVACNSCHMQNETRVHMTSWYPDVRLNHRAYAKANGTASCSNASCHGANLTGVALSGPSCSSCHTWPITNASGHPANWSLPTEHGVSAEQDFTVCQSCHGANYQGGSAATTCYQCHNGPGLDHPAANWVIANHKTAALAGNTGCKTCHGADFLGGGAHVACSSCHMQNETRVHMTSWYPDVILNHRAYAKTNGTASCSNASCHGANLTGVALSGPSCSSCHTWPFTAATCGSCHGIPPTTAGVHGAHTALGASITCNTCHSGAGTGTIKHQDGIVDVSMDAVYNGKSGTAAFNGTSKTCSNVSCHGGPRTQTATQAAQNPKQSTTAPTPSWLTGTIDVNTQCTACHVLGSAAGNPENNSYYSGRHYLHVYQRSRACTACHDTTKLTAGHFTGLATAALETPASATLLSGINYNSSTKSCTPSCHGSKTW